MSSDAMGDESCLVVEEISKEYGKSFRSMDLMEPMEKGRIRFIETVHVIWFSDCGVYLGRNFGRFPHYMVLKSRLHDTVLEKCFKWRIPVKQHVSNQQISTSSILCVWQLGREVVNRTTQCCRGNQELLSQNTLDTETRDKIRHYVDCLDLNGHDESNGHSNNCRGAKQEHFGYTSNHALKRCLSYNGSYTAMPCLIGGGVSDLWKTRFATMTNIGKEMYGHPLSLCITQNNSRDIYDDEERNQLISQKIHVDNCIEAITFSITDTEDSMLQIHVDSNNDETDQGQLNNYNYIVCAWQMQQTGDGRKIRSAIIAYSRRSISDFLTRETRCKSYCEKVVQRWLELQPYWKINTTPGSSIFDERIYEGHAYVNSCGDIIIGATINRQASYLSAFAGAILEFRKYINFESKQLQVNRNRFSPTYD